MFGNDSNVEEDVEKIVYKITTIERNSNDIMKVEMHLDPITRNINEMYLYVREGSDLLTLNEMLVEKYEGLSIDFNDKFIIIDRDYRIIIL